MSKNAIIFIPLTMLLLHSACQPSLPSNNNRREIPSRYDLISIEKVLPEQDDHPPILHSDEWKTPHPIVEPLNSAGLEDSPFIMPNGHTLLFFYTPSADIPADQQIYDQVTGIYQSKNTDDVWQEPVRVTLTQGDSLSLDGCPFFQDNLLWFCSIRAGKWNGTQWTDITSAGTYLNQDLQIGEMHLSSDGSTLIYHRPDENHSSGYDLWEVHWNGKEWGLPSKLDNLNSLDDDSRPALSPEGHELWFTRTYSGSPAIFRSFWVNGEWGTPELILSQFAGEPSIDSAGNIYFTHHFYKAGKMIEADIYIAEKK